MLRNALCFCIQCYGDAIRTDAIAVSVIIPYLLYGYAGFFRFVAVRQGRNLAFRHNSAKIISLRQPVCVLRPVVNVRFAICVLRKIINLHLPAVSLIQRYGLNELVRSIPPVSDLLFQVDFDLGRALTILIISVIPYLSDDYPDYLRGIGVGYVVAAYTCCIICYCILGDRIIDHFSIRILRQIFPFPAPGVRCRDSLYFIGQLCAVCKQVNLNLPWTLAILIVRIVPGLASADVNCLRCVRVGYIVAPYTCCITCYCILGDRIINFSSVRILRQICECPLPVICCRDSLYLIGQFCAIRIQTDRDAARTLAILVVRIVPILASADVDCHRDMHVGYVVTIHNSHVILYRILGDRVNDFFSFCILRQILPFPAPVVRCRDSLYLIGQLCAVCKQVNLNLTWALAILVICIVPDFASFDINCLRDVAITHKKTSSIRIFNFPHALIHISIQTFLTFLPEVIDYLTIFVLGKIIHSQCPTVVLACSQHIITNSSCDTSYLLFQNHGNTIRTFAVLITVIQPYLANYTFGCLRRIGVGYVVAAYTCCIICYCILGDRILNLGSVRILRQICECPLPVICCRDSLYLIGQLSVIRIQTDRDAAWTLAILVVIIVPGLASADVDQFFIYNFEALFSKVFYFHCKFISADRHLSVRFANFFHTVSNFIAVTIRDREVFPCVMPVVFCIQSRRITVLCFGSILRFTKQLNLYTCICWDIVFLYPLFSYHKARGFFSIFENNRIATGKFIQDYIVCVSFSF